LPDLLVVFFSPSLDFKTASWTSGHGGAKTYGYEFL